MTKISVIPFLSLLALTGSIPLMGGETAKSKTFFENIWDANQWERESGRSFWHALPAGNVSPDKIPLIRTPQVRPEKQQRRTPNLDFSNRQSEK